ncbi:MAG: porin, partial [Candidatus Latescibacterota bacterium]
MTFGYFRFPTPDPQKAIAATLVIVGLVSPAAFGQTAFNFGGFAKLDVLNSRYNDGDVASESPLRDFYFPAAIPTGGSGEFVDIDFHAKESRFNFGTNTKLGDNEVKSFVELDFMLSPGGNERVSNSFNPRLRHFYFEYDRWLFGQTWSNFQIVVLPEDLDFIGVPDGTIFVRQPQIRFATGHWRFSLENPETVMTEPASEEVIVTEAGRVPDFTVRYDLSGDWGTFG